MSDQENQTPTIPKPRFDSVLARAKEAEAALAALQSEHATLTKESKAWKRDADIVAELRTERDTLQGQLTSQGETNSAQMQMLGHGIDDPEVRDYLWHRYGNQEGERKEWEPWWGEQLESPGAVLRPFVAKADETLGVAPTQVLGGGQTQAEQDQAIVERAIAAPRSNAMAAPTPPAPAAYTPGSIAGLPREQRKAAIQAALGNGMAWPFT